MSTTLDSVAIDPPRHDPAESMSEIVIQPRSGWAALDLLEIWQHRELAYFLAWRDIKVRYKQTVLGAVWAILQPLLTMLVFTIFFGRLGRMQEQTSVPYPVCVYVSLLPWQFFGYCVVHCSQSLIASANMISNCKSNSKFLRRCKDG